MTAPRYDDINNVYAEFERSKRAIAQLHEEVLTQSTVARSRNRTIEVEVDYRGDLIGITFLSRSYRIMAAAELSKLIVDTVAQARRASLARVTETFQSIIPVGLPPFMFDGGSDVYQTIDHAMNEALRGGSGNRRPPDEPRGEARQP